MSKTDQEELFGQLRSIMNEDALEGAQAAYLWALCEHAKAQDPQAYAQQWVPYIGSFSQHFEGRIMRWFRYSDSSLGRVHDAEDEASAQEAFDAGLEALDRARELFPKAHFGLSFPIQSMSRWDAWCDPEYVVATLGERELWGLDFCGSPGCQEWLCEAQAVFPHLRYLGLDGCEVERPELELLLERAMFQGEERRLEFLGLYYSWFDGEGLTRAICSSELAGLETLNMELPEGVTHEAFCDSLGKARDRAEILEDVGFAERGRWAGLVEDRALEAAQQALAPPA